MANGAPLNEFSSDLAEEQRITVRTSEDHVGKLRRELVSGERELEIAQGLIVVQQPNRKLDADPAPDQFVPNRDKWMC